MTTASSSQAQPTCENCGAELFGPFCAECGQAPASPQPLWVFLRESLEELASLDGRLIRGLKDLALRPGYLTEEYLRGRRVAHIHPVRLIIVVSLIAYSVSAAFGPDQSGLLFGLTGTLTGDRPGWTGLLVVVLVLTLTAAAQRLVYWRSGRLYVEQAVLLLHVTSFAMLLAPIEVVVLSVLPDDPTGSLGFVALPILGVYWVLALRKVYSESLTLTLGRVVLVVTLATGAILATLTGLVALGIRG